VGYEVAVAVIILYSFRPKIIIIVIKCNTISIICALVSTHVEVISGKCLSKLLGEVVSLGHGVDLNRTMSTVGVARPMVIEGSNIRLPFSVFVLRFR